MISASCRPAVLCLPLLLVLVASPNLEAQAPDREVPPQRDAQGKLVKQGYRLWIERSQRENGGYMPVRVKLQAVPPLATDSVATIELDDNFVHWNGGSLLVEQDATLPAGQSAPINVNILLPMLNPHTQCEFRVWIDGELERGLNSYLPSISRHQYFGTHVLSAGAATERTRAFNLHGGPEGFHFEPLETFPQTWLGYTPNDIVHLPLEKLQELSRKHPQAFHALATWVAAGGNLWIEQAGSQMKELPQLDELLNSAMAPGNSTVSSDWQRPTLITGISNFVDPNYLQGSRIELDSQLGEAIEAAPQTPFSKEESEQMLDSIRSRPLGFGMVVVFRDSVIDTLPAILPNGVPEFADVSRVDWIVRNGVDPFDPNEDFWEWLIPGVGLPPVLEFQILITLFVIGIGPLNYFLLRRKRRLYLLVVTVPLSALLITGGLIGYAVVADGFHVRVRARSFTELDQRSGQAACWSRQTYYAGVAPSDGLHFPTDMAVFPKEVGVNSRHESRNASRVLKWGDDQHLAEGWLRSRTTTQFMCIRARQSPAALQVTSTPGKPPVVTNQLGSRILQLVLRDAEGKYFGAADIDAGGTITLDAAAAQTASAAARLSILEARPQALSSSNISLSPGRPYSGSYMLSGNESRLEASIEEARLALGGNLDLPPNSYIAIVEKSPEVEYGCSARQEGSLHVIRGRW